MDEPINPAPASTTTSVKSSRPRPPKGPKTPTRRMAPSNKEKARALSLGKSFRMIARRKHPQVQQLEEIFSRFRTLRDESRDTGAYNGNVERPLWAAFLRGIANR